MNVHHRFTTSSNFLSVSAPSGVPQNFSADPGEREVVFSWSAPLITQRNGVITNYTLSCSPSPSSLPQSPSSGPLTVTGLSPDTSYSCSLVASNSEGSGPPANISFTTQQDCKPLSRPNSELSIDIVIDMYFQIRLSGVLACSELIVSVYAL